MKIYDYIGATELLKTVGHSSTRRVIKSENDLLIWFRETLQEPDIENEIVTTFIISLDSKLWIADRRSEHVVCADGNQVLSAGEMTFQLLKNDVVVSRVSNQSTGYCPEPESWPNVAQALNNVGLKHPTQFTSSFAFRRCTMCHSTNIVKEDWFVCGVCDADLDVNWNFDK